MTMFHMLRPLALLAGTTTLLHRNHHCASPTAPLAVPQKRAKLAEVKRDNMGGDDFSILRVIVMVVKRYYLGIMRASFKAWL